MKIPTEQQMREVVRNAVLDVLPDSQEDADAIAGRAAKELAGATVGNARIADLEAAITGQLAAAPTDPMSAPSVAARRIEELEDAMRTAIDALMVGIPAPEILERLQAVLDDADRRPAAEQPSPAVQTVRVGPTDTVVIVEALELWDRYLTAPHADIKRILGELTGKAPS